jgi:hypothetical protein
LSGPGRTFMLTFMRTTLMLDDALFRELKHRAAESGTSASDLVNVILREAFRPRMSEPPLQEYRTVTYGDPATVVPFTPGDMAKLLEDDEFERYSR